MELRLDGRHLDDRLEWLLGFFTSEDSVEDMQEWFFTTNSAVFQLQPGLNPIADHNLIEGEQDAESDAAFANMDYTLTDYLEVSLGVRYTEEIRKFAGCGRQHPDDGGATGFDTIFNVRSLQEGGSGGSGPGDCYTLDEETRNPSLIRKELEEDNFGGKVALTWRPTVNHLFYASYSRGFKSGSFPIIAPAEGSQYDPVTQERVDAIELGGKTSWFDDVLRVDFALFDYEYTDKQLLSFFIDPVFGPLAKLFNAPESSVRGAELEIQSSPLPGLFIAGAASYLDTEVIEFIGVTADGEEDVDFSGNELPFAPKYSYTLRINYTFPLPFLSQLEGTAGFDYSYVGEATSVIEDDPLFDIASYNLANARLGVGSIDDHWDVTAWVRNATNEFYQRNVPLVVGPDTRVRFTGMPQTVGITLAYRYF